MKRPTGLLFLLPILLGSSLLWIPLLGDFHIESAILASCIGCFWAALRGCKVTEGSSDFFRALEIGGFLFLGAVPLGLFALLTGCFSLDGLGYWLLFPLPSVFLGFSIGRLLRIWQIPYRSLLSVLILLILGGGLVAYEFFHYPQVYFFNHVWGGWPGPIYDETVRVSSTTFFYRSVTMMWALLLWHIPTFNKDKASKGIVALSVGAIAFSYLFFAEMGVVSPRSHLQQVLGGHKDTSHFNLYYDHRLYSQDEVELLAQEHEFNLYQIRKALNLPEHDTTHKIESYLYGHAWQKKALTGAKFTSYVPVWLDKDQLHIAKQQLGSLKHELVHVVAKEFGNEVLNASWSIGFVEGLAVALSGGTSSTSTIDQVVASQIPYPTVRELKNIFSPVGFYSGRAGANYITAGSFVRFLMQNYPVAPLKEAYKTADIAQAYELPWSSLVSNWHKHLDSIPIDTVDEKVAGRIFGIPSLFEQQCPHSVSPFEKLWDQYQYNLANHDTLEALPFLNEALTVSDSLASLKVEWSYRHLKAGGYKQVQEAASLQDTLLDLQLLYADAFAMTGDENKARSFLIKARELVGTEPDSRVQPALSTRSNRKQWEIYRQLVYQRELPELEVFQEALYRTKIRSLRQAIEQERWKLVSSYGKQLLEGSLKMRYFEDYRRLIHYLGFLGEIELARQWIQKVSKLPLRRRQYEQLDQEKAWVDYSS